jgi:hypothetical protein
LSAFFFVFIFLRSLISVCPFSAFPLFFTQSLIHLPQYLLACALVFSDIYAYLPLKRVLGVHGDLLVAYLPTSFIHCSFLFQAVPLSSNSLASCIRLCLFINAIRNEFSHFKTFVSGLLHNFRLICALIKTA